MSLLATSRFDAVDAGRAMAMASSSSVTAEIVDTGRWDELASRFDGVVQEQVLAYAATRWASARPEAVVFRDHGEIVGGALMMIQHLPLRLGAIAICKWGPIFRESDRCDAPALYGAMIEALVDEYAVARGMTLSVLPRAVPAAENWQFAQLLARGFRRGVSLLFPNRYLVRLGLPEAMQRRSLGQKWRHHLGRAERAGLSFETAGVERLPEFDRLYRAMAARKNFPDYSAYDTIPALFAAAEPALRPALFFVRHAGEVVAGAIIFTAGDTAVYLFGATDDRALPLNAGYFLHWRIIGWLGRNSRAKWYDLGGTDGFQGLHQFKKGMVGSAGIISQVPPVANYAASRWRLLLGNAAFSARSTVHRLRWHLENRLGGRARPDQKRG